MNVTKASWSSVVGICLIAVILLAINGYTGYSVTVGAVAIAAAVNLT